MVCPNCNNRVSENDKFCMVCGNPVNSNCATENVVNRLDIEKQKNKRHRWIWICIIVIVIVIFLKYLGSPNRSIDSVKESTLYAYDYGKTIGVALNNWFDGTEEWYTMEDEDQLYVCVRGKCQYWNESFEPTQIFLFRISDDNEYFYFEGAYDMNENPIFSNASNLWDNWAAGFANDLYGVDFHELAVKAAFGDEESLNIIRNSEE